MEVFSQNHAVPFSKMLTFFRKEPFSMKAFYAGNIPYPDLYIGKYCVILDLLTSAHCAWIPHSKYVFSKSFTVATVEVISTDTYIFIQNSGM
jgi:hypothetical protein